VREREKYIVREILSVRKGETDRQSERKRDRQTENLINKNK
jgi:hypothetical protein